MINRPVTPRLWWALLAIFMTCLLMNFGSLIYANHVATKSAQYWCDIVTTLDDAYRAQPPTTQTGRKIAEEMHELRGKLSCKGG